MAERATRGTPPLVAHWKGISAALGVVIVVGLVVHAAVIRPMVRLSGDREAVLDQRQGELARVQADVRTLEAAVSKVACTRGDLRHVFEERLSSKEARLTAILREVRQLALDHRMPPDRLQFQAQHMTETGLVRFSIAFPLEGPYETLRSFIRQVESSENFLLVENVTLSGQRGLGQDLRLQVRVVTYFMGTEADVLERLASRGLDS